MFDHVTFTGTINLGAIVTSITSILSAYAILIRVRAIIAEHDLKNKLPGGRRKEDPPALPPEAGNNAENQISQKQNNYQDGNNNNPG